MTNYHFSFDELNNFDEFLAKLNDDMIESAPNVRTATPRRILGEKERYALRRKKDAAAKSRMKRKANRTDSIKRIERNGEVVGYVKTGEKFSWHPAWKKMEKRQRRADGKAVCRAYDGYEEECELIETSEPAASETASANDFVLEDCSDNDAYPSAMCALCADSDDCYDYQLYRRNERAKKQALEEASKAKYPGILFFKITNNVNYGIDTATTCIGYFQDAEAAVEALKKYFEKGTSAIGSKYNKVIVSDGTEPVLVSRAVYYE